MDNRERFSDPVEGFRTALEGSMAEVWTALPGIVQDFDTVAMTVSVQPSIRGRVTQPDGTVQSVDLPLLVDVPVIFPAGGEFVLTMPIHAGDEALVVFASRCIDAWWQHGGIGEPLEPRMHNLSDGFAFVGPFSQARVLPGVSADNVQLRTKDGEAAVTITPDYTITASNPAASVELTPAGTLSAQADTSITLQAPDVAIKANSFSLANFSGGAVTASMDANIALNGKLTSTGDQVAGGISQQQHTHTGVTSGGDNTGGPR